jgi:hypothetical protein
MCIGFHVKYPLFCSDFNKTKIFSADFSKIPEVANSMKILKVGAELFRADRQGDKHDKAILYKEPTRCNFGSIVY